MEIKSLREYTAEQLQLIGVIEEMIEGLDGKEALEILEAVKDRLFDSPAPTTSPN